MYFCFASTLATVTINYIYDNWRTAHSKQSFSLMKYRCEGWTSEPDTDDVVYVVGKDTF